LRAGFAANTAALIKIDNTVIPLMQSLDRTNINTWGFSAMVAAKNSKISFTVGKGALFNILHPSTVYTKRYLVF